MFSNDARVLGIGLISCRVNSRKRAKTLPPSSVTTRRLVPTLPMLRKKENIRRFVDEYLLRRRRFCLFICFSLI